MKPVEGLFLNPVSFAGGGISIVNAGGDGETGEEEAGEEVEDDAVEFEPLLSTLAILLFFKSILIQKVGVLL